MRQALTPDAAATGEPQTYTQAPKHPETFVALVGSPNAGKTTLFNWLTGSRFKTVNYPGATVDYSIGKTQERYGVQVNVMDTPGTYSLNPKSPDEVVTYEAIFNHKTFGTARAVVSVVDATHLSRQLLITRQLIDTGFPVVLAVTMSDLLKESHELLDTEGLSNQLGVPVVLIDGRLGGGIAKLVQVINETNARLEIAPAHPHPEKAKQWTDEKVEAALAENSALVKSVLQKDTKSAVAARLTTARERTRKLDQILLHPVFGLVIFFGLMAGLFSSIFWAAAPVMDFIDGTFSDWAEATLAIAPENLFVQFLANGVLASLGAVLVFIPQIFILFTGITVLEDSGYLARSATLVDKPLSLLGLGGRSFVPILSGYACAIPAMMATRTISSRRERWLTLFIVPLMSCSARLPVYALFLAFLFHDQPAWHAGLMLAGIYFASLLVGALAAYAASKIINVEDRSFFMMELPVYRRPRTRLVLRQAVTRTISYIKRAGAPIFIFAVIIWVGTTFPNYKEEDASARLNSSYAADLGHIIQPVFEPMGGDWRTGVGLISAFAAREVFVSSLAVVMQIASDDEATIQESLITKMQEAKAPNGYPLFTVASVLALIVYFMIALQCLATSAVAARESGGWKFALMQLFVFNAVAYVVAVAIVQGLRAVGIA